MAKKLILLAAALACCALLTAVGTTAHFTGAETSYNVISMGSLAMTLHQETADGKPFPTAGIRGVVPGQASDLLVYVENTGAAAFYVRTAVETSILPEALSAARIALDIDTVNWTLRDGWYYYNAAVPAGEKTKPLFTQLTLDAETDNSYMDAEIHVRVNAQVVQSKNNAASAPDAVGWPQ